MSISIVAREMQKGWDGLQSLDLLGYQCGCRIRAGIGQESHKVYLCASVIHIEAAACKCYMSAINARNFGIRGEGTHLVDFFMHERHRQHKLLLQQWVTM